MFFEFNFILYINYTSRCSILVICYRSPCFLNVFNEIRNIICQSTHWYRVTLRWFWYCIIYLCLFCRSFISCIYFLSRLTCDTINNLIVLCIVFLCVIGWWCLSLWCLLCRYIWNRSYISSIGFNCSSISCDILSICWIQTIKRNKLSIRNLCHDGSIIIITKYTHDDWLLTIFSINEETKDKHTLSQVGSLRCRSSSTTCCDGVHNRRPW